MQEDLQSNAWRAKTMEIFLDENSKSGHIVIPSLPWPHHSFHQKKSENFVRFKIIVT